MAERLKKDFTPEEIVSLVRHLGSEDFRRGSKGEYIFQTICHNRTGGSYKLYYYPESKMFHCYTACGDSFDVYELVQRVCGCGFSEAYRLIYDYFGLQAQAVTGFYRDTELDDWDMIRKYIPSSKISTTANGRFLPKSLLHLYSDIPPQEWLSEGISAEAMRKFGIRFSIHENKIVIPDFDRQGNLIGVRGRALNPDEAIKEKYKPMTIVVDGQPMLLNYPTGHNLYGLYENIEAIKSTQKIMLFEGEKSVLKCETFYPNNNFSVAVCGSQISIMQRDMILGLGVKEVLIGFDKEYKEVPSPESELYGDKLIRLAKLFSPFVTTYVLWDEKDLLGYKDSPVDKGRGVFESLLQEKIEIETGEGNTCRKKKK